MDAALFASNMTIWRSIDQLRGGREAWQVRRHIFMASFQTFYESYLVSGEARPLYDLAPSASA